mgnify:FL=1
MSKMRQTQKTEKKDNRKSILLIALLLMLVAIIGFGGYTLSKYITSKKSEGSAQVAKWGYTITANSDNLFGKNYKYVTNSSVVTTDTANLTVSASGDYNVVAPGTKGSMSFTIKGKAEVKSKITIAMSDVKDVTLKYTEGEATAVNTYNPVKWTLKKNGGEVTGATGVTLATLLTKLNAETTYEAGAPEVDDTYTIEWAWAFEDGTVKTDALDTLLGMIANNNAVTENQHEGVTYKKAEGTVTETSFKLSLSVVQVKE